MFKKAAEKFRKIAAAALAASMIAGCLAGCGSQGQESSGQSADSRQQEADQAQNQSQDAASAQKEPVTLKVLLSGDKPNDGIRDP